MGRASRRKKERREAKERGIHGTRSDLITCDAAYEVIRSIAIRDGWRRLVNTYDGPPTHLLLNRHEYEALMGELVEER